MVESGRGKTLSSNLSKTLGYYFRISKNSSL